MGDTVTTTVAAQPLQPATAPSVQTPATPVQPVVAPPTLSVHASDWQTLQTELADLRKYRGDVETQAASKEKERVDMLAAQSNMKDELRKLEEANSVRYAEVQKERDGLRGRILNGALSSTLASSLNSVDVVGDDVEEKEGNAAMIRRLLSDEVEAVFNSAGDVVVRDKRTHKPADEYLREQLSGKRFARLIKPSTSGGSGAGNAAAIRAPGTQAEQPSYLDQVVADWQKRQGEYQSFGLRPKAPAAK